MKIVHRISFRASDKQLQELKFLGVNVPPGALLPGDSDPFVGFDVDEDHPNWGILSGLFEKWGVSDAVGTKFSKQEIRSARHSVLLPEWHHGYPQPDDLNFGYLQATYDLTNYCAECGTGLVQSAPFQMRGEPKWGRRGIMQLNWVFDEYFVTPEVWGGIFSPFGVEARPVNDVKGNTLKTVVQLVIPEVVGIRDDGLAKEACPRCNRMKYSPEVRGFFPPLAEEPASAISKTIEYFGSGGSAHKAVVVSHALAMSMMDANLKGVSFRPVA